MLAAPKAGFRKGAKALGVKDVMRVPALGLVGDPGGFGDGLFCSVMLTMLLESGRVSVPSNRAATICETKRQWSQVL